MIAEIKPRVSNKGSAIRCLMQTPPFRGRIPLFFGDDITDEDGFRTVNELGGISVKVGFADPSCAGCCLKSPEDVLGWLEAYLNFLAVKVHATT